jgi:hypothetical protein
LFAKNWLFRGKNEARSAVEASQGGKCSWNVIAMKGIKINDIIASGGFNMGSIQPSGSGGNLLEKGTYIIYPATDSIWPTNRLGLMWGNLRICRC